MIPIMYSAFCYVLFFQYVVTQQGDVSNPEAIITSFGQASVISDYAISSKPAQGSVETTILFNIEVQDCVSVWIIIVSVIGSLLLLSVTVIVLYMVSFSNQAPYEVVLLIAVIIYNMTLYCRS